MYSAYEQAQCQTANILTTDYIYFGAVQKQKRYEHYLYFVYPKMILKI